MKILSSAVTSYLVLASTSCSSGFVPAACRNSSSKLGTSLNRIVREKVLSRAPLFSSSAISNKKMTPRGAATISTDADATTSGVCTNPLLSDWSSQPFNLPPFDSIEPSNFPDALEKGRTQHMADLQAIVDNTETPSFDNVMVPYDYAGGLLGKVAGVFYNLCSSLNTDELQKIQMEQSAISSRHASATYTLPGLFDKIKAVYETRNDSDLTPEQIRLVERVYMDFTRAGAQFDVEKQKEYAEIKAELAELSTKFTQNVMKDEETYELILSKDDMDGCPDFLIDAAKQAASERNKAEDQYVITLSRSLVEPFLIYSNRRDLRQQAWEAWTKRGELSPERDNIAIGEQILKLRLKQAQLHGYKTFAEYQCVDRMAKTPEKVLELCNNVWERAKDAAQREKQALEDFVKDNEGGDKLGDDGIKPWDWRYYAEKVRKAKYDFDGALLKPYLSLDSVTDALFSVSNQLFGLKYVLRDDIKAYHPDVKVYEVRDESTDEVVSLFFADNYARKFKGGGAWMSEYRSQTKNLAPGSNAVEAIPIVTNNNNFAKSDNTLLSFDDAETLFHEAGHGHHGMLSDATYERLASTNVLSDFVELPSQLMEHWFRDRSILKQYGKHYETGESIPDELLDKLFAAKSFNQGFDTVEYTVCALLDMMVHSLESYDDDFSLAEFEKDALQKLGMPDGIVMRHRPAHFQHLFSGSSYAAGYYVYLWAEVLDADVFAAFKETGDIFNKDVAQKARKYIYSAGNTVAPDVLFRNFRGRDPDIQYMLKKKGLLVE